MSAYQKRKISKRIEISKQLIEVGDKSVIKDTLLHECLHYALFTLGLPYKDEDKYFVSEARRLGIGLTDEVYVGYEYVVKCNKCNKIAITEIKNRINKKYIGTKYKTNCCKEGYTHIKTIVHNGIEELEITQ